MSDSFVEERVIPCGCGDPGCSGFMVVRFFTRTGHIELDVTPSEDHNRFDLDLKGSMILNTYLTRATRVDEKVR